MEGTGLVLSGGGGKGIYQVGILKSLAAAGLLDDVVAVSGSSIGGINAVLFAEGVAEGGVSRAIEQMEEVWNEIDLGVIFNFDYSKIQAGDMHFSRKKTEELIDKYLTYDLFKTTEDKSMMPVFVTGARCPEGIVSSEQVTQEEMKLILSASVEDTYRDYAIEYFKLNDQDNGFIRSALLATTSLPVIFSPVDVNGSLYVDGGMKDNSPIKPLYDLGIRRFIVVELSTTTYVKDMNAFADAEIIDILSSVDLGQLLSGTLNFDKQDLAFKKTLGELDGKRYIKTLFEKDEAYIAMEKQLAKMDYDHALQMQKFNSNYDSLSSTVNDRFDYIKNLEESLKKYDI